MKNFSEISVSHLREYLKIKEIQLIDVREPSEFNDGSIEHSINIPLSCLLSEIDDFQFVQKIVMICKVGVRSKIACDMIQAEGYNLDLYNLSGGINAWQNSGYEIKK